MNNKIHFFCRSKIIIIYYLSLYDKLDSKMIHGYTSYARESKAKENTSNILLKTKYLFNMKIEHCHCS